MEIKQQRVIDDRFFLQKTFFLCKAPPKTLCARNIYSFALYSQTRINRL